MKRLCFVAMLAAWLSLPALAATTNVTSVADLIGALQVAKNTDEIVVMASGSPYEFTSDQKDMVAHLYARVRIRLRGETGNPADVVLRGNANRILYLKGNGNTIRDLTFENGDCTGYDQRSDEPKDTLRGGAIYLYVDNDSTTVISNCVFKSCKSMNGGGACGTYGLNKQGGQYFDCVFDGNCTSLKSGTQNTMGGGAVFRAVSVKNCTFKNNYSGTLYGGALYGVPDVAGCSIVSNATYATSSTGGFGGGVFGCTLTGCYVASNYAYRCGAAADSAFYSCTNRANDAFGYTEFGKSSAASPGCYAEDCVFLDAGRAAVTMFGSSGFNRCRLENMKGGCAFSQYIAMTNCLVANGRNVNTYFYNLNADSSMVNCTVVSNSWGDKFIAGSSKVLTVKNCFFYGNDIPNTAPNVVTAFNNCILSAESDAHVPGSGNYNYYSERATFKPGFVGVEKDPANPFAITRRSPAFAKAGIVEGWMSTATDIRGEGFPRLRDGAVNIGCYQCWDVIPGFTILFR